MQRVSPTLVISASCALLFLQLCGVARAQADPKLKIGMTIAEVGSTMPNHFPHLMALAYEDEAGQIYESIDTWMKRFNETNGIMVQADPCHFRALSSSCRLTALNGG